MLSSRCFVAQVFNLCYGRLGHETSLVSFCAMNHRPWILLSAALISGGLAFSLAQPREPVFEGKRLSAWLEAFDYESEELVNEAIPPSNKWGRTQLGR